MRFKKIEFNNYRCFLEGEISFSEDNNKNINLVLGPNGGGKTEILFAFWWTLYEFDFSSLRGKENTPYALNTDLYKELENKEFGTTQMCSVVLELEHENKLYNIKKWCDYRKNEKKIMVHEYQEVSFYNEKHELELPIRDEKEIKKILNRIVPKSILYGIIFDGERMQKLSSVDETSNNAIKGVISDITNVELIEQCIVNYKSLQKEISKLAKNSAKKYEQYELEKVIEYLTQINNEEVLGKESLEINRLKLEESDIRLDKISIEMQKFEETKKIEEQRNEEKRIIEKDNEKLVEHYKNFEATLKNSYLQVCNKLFDDVNERITKYDIPEGLMVEAVKSILKRDTCICGTHMSDEVVKKLNNLILTLPPDNVNSTLSEIVRQMSVHKESNRASAKKDYSYISRCEEIIKKSKETVASLSAQITKEGRQDAAILENERKNILLEKGNLIVAIPKQEDEIKSLNSEIEKYISIRDNLSKYSGELVGYNVRIAFIEKCLKAMDVIKDKNKNIALKIINDKLEKAYEILSEDAELGRKIYIIQYSEEKRYQIIVYLQSNLNVTLNIFKKRGEYQKFLNNGYSEDEIKELAIIKCKDSNSTGQSKMNTLSFAKAILDYSNERKSEDSIEIAKDYPLLIDAPFGDIFDQNLMKSSRELHTFTNQIILMLSRESYQSVKDNLKDYVGNVYEFTKQENQNFSIIHEVKGEI
ncbi:AAA family ATPase [Clostridium tagluense]|uniref:AAA family ATPase n=1 Tax=Clostridium tagluense TaxID=360422 RepID=UPI001C0D8AB3|nr:AAA family ATPase [Clostridium tagluense]MBU3129012.1 hypothetical protein [Clostridium tagluense]